MLLQRSLPRAARTLRCAPSLVRAAAGRLWPEGQPADAWVGHHRSGNSPRPPVGPPGVPGRRRPGIVAVAAVPRIGHLLCRGRRRPLLVGPRPSRKHGGRRHGGPCPRAPAFRRHAPSHTISRRTRGAQNVDIVLYQYQVCPFCNKVRGDVRLAARARPPAHNRACAGEGVPGLPRHSLPRGGGGADAQEGAPLV